MITFINNLELYAAARTLNATNKGALILAAIRGPAKTYLNAAIVGGLAAPVDAASNIGVIAWLRATYHTVDIQQQLKDQLLSTVQEVNLPREFYTRIRDIIEVAGYVDAVQDQVTETTFIQGLIPDLIMAV